MEEKIKEIAGFWLNFEFLKKFKELGDKYSKLIKKEKELEVADADNIRRL